MTLIEQVQGLLERTYRMRSGLARPERFVIGDRGYRELYAAAGRTDLHAPGADGPGGERARTLVREIAGDVRVCVYYPDTLIRRLERHPPQRGVHEQNVDAFATLVEELDHLLTLAERARLARPVTLFELELHANVSKYLVLARYLAGRQDRLATHRRLWLRHHLFHKQRYCDRDPEVRQRYRDATRWGVRLLDALGQRTPAVRLQLLRAFHEATTQAKLELIRRAAA